MISQHYGTNGDVRVTSQQLYGPSYVQKLKQPRKLPSVPPSGGCARSSRSSSQSTEDSVTVRLVGMVSKVVAMVSRVVAVVSRLVAMVSRAVASNKEYKYIVQTSEMNSNQQTVSQA